MPFIFKIMLAVLFQWIHLASGHKGVDSLVYGVLRGVFTITSTKPNLGVLVFGFKKISKLILLQTKDNIVVFVLKKFRKS